MPRFHPTKTRFMALSAGLAVTAGVSLPAAAAAGQSHVVTLNPPAEGTTCEQTIFDVTAHYAISPRSVYTSSLCGFTATLPKKTVDSLRLDPRVRSVTADGTTYYTAA